MNIIIVGGGVIGLLNSYYLNQLGHNITIIDDGDITNSTSFGNAGVVSCFDKTPMAYPGVIKDTIINILKGTSPLTFHPSLDIKTYRWLYKFVRNANPLRVKQTMELFETYGQLSINAYEDLIAKEQIDFDFNHGGLALAYLNNAKYQKALKNFNSDTCEIIHKNNFDAYLPFVESGNIAGMVNTKRNAWLDPGKLMFELKHLLQRKGVHFVLNEQITTINKEREKVVSISSDTAEYKADEFILATGHKEELFKQLGINLEMIPAKGYSITCDIDEKNKPRYPTLIMDIFTMVAPRKDNLRITSKIELNSTNYSTNLKKVRSILRNIENISTDFHTTNEVYWNGHRPLTPNDLPLLGRAKKYNNITIATGAGWLGITFAPAIAKIVSELIHKKQNNEENADIMSFSGFYQ